MNIGNWEIDISTPKNKDNGVGKMKKEKADDEFWNKGSFAQTMSSEEMKKKIRMRLLNENRQK